MRVFIPALIFVAAVFGGCASSSDSAGDLDSIALPVFSGDVQDSGRCNASIGEASTFAIVNGHAELIAVFDPDSDTEICVDTFDTIESNLGIQSLRSERLWRRYTLSLQEVGQSLGQVLPKSR